MARPRAPRRRRPCACRRGCASTPPPPVSVYHSTGAWATATATGTKRPGSVPRARARAKRSHRGPRFVGAARPPRSCKRSCGLCCAPLCEIRTRALRRARVGRGGGRRRDAARPAPAQAPAAGRVRAVLAGARRARARRAALAAARRGHLRAADVGLLRPLRHARRRPRRPAARGCKVDYPIRFDRALGLGTTPTIRLQRALGREGHVGPLEYGLSAVHWSWFLVPHGTLAYVLLRHREHYQRSAVHDGRLLRPRLRRLLAACRRRRPGGPGANGNMPPVRRIMAEAGRALLATPLAPALPFAARQSVRRHALTPLRNVSDGRPHPVAGRPGAKQPSGGSTRSRSGSGSSTSASTT